MHIFFVIKPLNLEILYKKNPATRAGRRGMNIMSKIPILFELMNERGLTAKKVSVDTGISTGNISDWKSGRSKPSSEKLRVLAEYFNVTTDYLLGKTEPNNNTAASPAPLNEAEAELLKLYRQLEQKNKNIALKIIMDLQDD